MASPKASLLGSNARAGVIRLVSRWRNFFLPHPTEMNWTEQLAEWPRSRSRSVRLDAAHGGDRQHRIVREAPIRAAERSEGWRGSATPRTHPRDRRSMGMRRIMPVPGPGCPARGMARPCRRLASTGLPRAGDRAGLPPGRVSRFQRATCVPPSPDFRPPAGPRPSRASCSRNRG